MKMLTLLLSLVVLAGCCTCPCKKTEDPQKERVPYHERYHRERGVPY